MKILTVKDYIKLFDKGETIEFYTGMYIQSLEGTKFFDHGIYRYEYKCSCWTQQTHPVVEDIALIALILNELRRIGYKELQFRYNTYDYQPSYFTFNIVFEL